MLIQTDQLEDYSPVIKKAVEPDQISIAGIVGNWKDGSQFLNHYRTINPRFQLTFQSREILYAYDLSQWEPVEPDQRVRLLVEEDFAQWDQMNRWFLQEEGIPVQGTRETRFQGFKKKVEDRHWWGLFQGLELISIAAYNARYKDIAQIGGVFTVKDQRRKGLSRACMNALINDSLSVHDVKKLILFTGEMNESAIGLYESIGFKKIGEFGLFFGKDRKSDEV